MQRRDRGINQALGAALNKRVKGSKILLVGAGGIGCEILKNTVCCGFGHITIVDLDTIDLSNLNRQFLFRKQHIKKPKAFVAKETASRFNPSVQIDAQHASIYDTQYDVNFFQSFDLVFNALDNLAARRHVNKMCLAADVPLIESGTTGYKGQVQPIKKGITECYDCNEKPVQKSFAICTIRSTPSQPIHCIVWAKSYLLPELFGASEEQEEMSVTAEDNAEEVAKLREEAQALQKIREMMGNDDFAKSVFNKVFGEDIERLRGMTDMWKTRNPPDALHYDQISHALDGEAVSKEEQKVWSVEENTAVFCDSLHRLSARKKTEGVIEFDKDDKDTLDLVASAANLRAHIFGIAVNSEWEIKQMAGNIIPAIATSNAMTASLCVLTAFKIFRGLDAKTNSAPLGGSRMTFLEARNTQRMIASDKPQPPKPECPVCSPTYARLKVTEITRLQDVVNLLKQKIGYTEFSIANDQGIIYDPEEDGNLLKALQDLNVTNFLTVTDEDDEPRQDLVLAVIKRQSECTLEPDSIQVPLKPVKQMETEIALPSGLKRKREAEDELNGETKKSKVDDTAIVIEDDGTILLDD